MDNKIKGIIVSLRDGIPDECRDELMDAIRMLKGVVDVSPVTGENSFKESLIVRNVCSQIGLKIDKLSKELSELKT